MKTPHESREEHVVESTESEYVAPRVEVVLAPQDLEREILYAGTFSNPV